MYESKAQKIVSRKRFAKRLATHVFLAFALLLVSLGAGIYGYCYFENLSVLDAFLNSAMLLGGMGPVNPPLSAGVKLFAGCYALYAGLVFIVTAALIFTPVAHRILHKFHWDTK